MKILSDFPFYWENSSRGSTSQFQILSLKKMTFVIMIQQFLLGIFWNHFIYAFSWFRFISLTASAFFLLFLPTILQFFCLCFSPTYLLILSSSAACCDDQSLILLLSYERHTVTQLDGRLTNCRTGCTHTHKMHALLRPIQSFEWGRFFRV